MFYKFGSGKEAHGSFEVFQEGREWFWWPCFPGCLPDGDKSGPFKTEEEAIGDARSYDD